MAYVQIDSITPRVVLDGKSAITFRASTVDYAGAMAVWYEVSIDVGNTHWEYGKRVKSGASIVPDIALMEAFTDSAETTATVTVAMVNSTGASLGTAGAENITLVADEALARPEINGEWAMLSADNHLTTLPAGVYVKGSRLMATFDASKILYKYGAKPADLAMGRWTVAIGNNSVTSDGMLFYGDVLAVTIPAYGEVSVTCTATDSRGFSVSQTFTITAYEYAQPVLSGIEIYRSDAAGKETDTGTYIRVKADASVSDLNGKNAIVEFYVTFKPATGEVETQALTSGEGMFLGSGYVIPARSYRVGIYLFDACGGSAKYEIVVPTVSAAFNILPGGKGAAFGRLAEKEKTLDVNDWDIETEGNIRAANLHPVGSVYMSAYDADPAAMFGGYWNEVTTTNLPFKVWYRVPD